MTKITLQSGDNSITTTCKGVSQHIYNSYVVHGLSKKGKEWIDSLPGGATYANIPIMVYTRYGTWGLDYLTDNPVP